MFCKASSTKIAAICLLSFLCIVLLYVDTQSSPSREISYNKGDNRKTVSDVLRTAGYNERLDCERTLVLYAYVESKERRENLQFFLDFAIGKNRTDPNIDYVIIVNGYACTAGIPTLDNVYVIKRENSGFDACAWKHGLDMMHKTKGENWYKYVFFMNASVRGPFLPVYATDRHWTSLFTKYFSEDVKLVGTSIYCPSPEESKLHLQSMFLATDSVGLTILKPLLQCFKKKALVIKNVEVKITQTFLQKGYNVASMLKRWKGHDFRDKEKTFKMCQHDIKDRPHGDPYFHNMYYLNINISPFEVIFFKTNRDVNNDLIKAYTQMMYENI